MSVIEIAQPVYDVTVAPEQYVVDVALAEYTVSAISGLVAYPVPGGGASRFSHTQVSASAAWTINHNLGYYPAVQTRTTGHVVFQAKITHTSTNTAIIELTTPLAGYAECI